MKPETSIQHSVSSSRSRGSRPAVPLFWIAFTLIELLIVIAIISLLAAMIIPITGAVNRNKIRAKARAELAQIETAIENYKTKIGHYPPDNPGRPSTNQLYYELLGTTNNNGTFGTIDGSSSLAPADFPMTFGPNVTGFINTSQGSTDEARTATPFIVGVKPSQVGQWNPPFPAKFLVSSVLWDQPGVTWTLGVPNLNPICYNSSNPTNNPKSYDLWVDVLIAGKTNRICNWSKDPIYVYLVPPTTE